MNVLRRLVFVLAASLWSTLATAQVLPPVNIPIQNIPQQTPVWCWAAVAQQIIAASRGLQNTPPQCALVAVANRVAPPFCCSTPNPICLRTGSVSQIQGLISAFGGHTSSLAPPANPMALYNTLAAGRPIILQVQTGIASAHVVVLRGMSFQRTPFGAQPVLYINDPLAYFTQPVPFQNLVPIWSGAIVVN